MYLSVGVFINGTELQNYAFSEPEVLIGRGRDCHIQLDNAGVSRHHAKLTAYNHNLQITDLDSGNGTYLNGQRIEQAGLSANDGLRIGKFTLVVKLSEQRSLTAVSAPSVTANDDTASADSTVYLRPGEAQKILQHPAGIPARGMAATTPQVEKPNSALGYLGFAAGSLVGLLCGWFFWG